MVLWSPHVQMLFCVNSLNVWLAFYCVFSHMYGYLVLPTISLYYMCPSLDMEDSGFPMYAVINNFMGSGSVTYECEGHETRLSDCMSPLSSTIAPCYYALVKCFSITDKGSGGSTTSGSSAGIVAGVVVSLLAVLLVVTIVIITLIVWLKRRAKPADNDTSTTSPPSPQSPPAVIITGGTGASNVPLELTNPTYQPTSNFQPAQTNGTPEYEFINPLYSTATEAVVN